MRSKEAFFALFSILTRDLDAREFVKECLLRPWKTKKKRKTHKNGHMSISLSSIQLTIRWLTMVFLLANFVDPKRSATLSSLVRLRSGQRGRIIVPRRRGDHRDEWANWRRQLDGRCPRKSAWKEGNVPDQFRAHAARLTFGKPELVGKCLQYCQLRERC